MESQRESIINQSNKTSILYKVHLLAELVCLHHGANLIKNKQEVSRQFMQKAKLVICKADNTYTILKHRHDESVLRAELKIINISLDCINRGIH